jgi:WD40 repeat protein
MLHAVDAAPPARQLAMIIASSFALLLSVSAVARSEEETAAAFVPRPIAACDEGITQIALDPTGQTLFVATERADVAAWDLKKQSFRWQWDSGGTHPVIGLDAGPEIVTFIGGSASVARLEAKTGKPLDTQILGVGKGKSTSIAHDPNGKWTWVGMKEGALYRPLADAGIAHGSLKVENKGVTAVALDSDGKQLAVGGEDGTIRFVNARTGSIEERKVIDAHDGPVAALVWAKNDSWLISASGSTVRCWNASSRGKVFAIESQSGAVTCVAADPTGKLVAWGDEQGNAHLWSVADQKLIADLRDDSTSPVRNVLFVDKGKSLAAAMGRRHVSVWDLTKMVK